MADRRRGTRALWCVDGGADLSMRSQSLQQMYVADRSNRVHVDQYHATKMGVAQSPRMISVVLELDVLARLHQSPVMPRRLGWFHPRYHPGEGRKDERYVMLDETVAAILGSG